jgi:hypothetical protein
MPGLGGVWLDLWDNACNLIDQKLGDFGHINLLQVNAAHRDRLRGNNRRQIHRQKDGATEEQNNKQKGDNFSHST